MRVQSHNETPFLLSSIKACEAWVCLASGIQVCCNISTYRCLTLSYVEGKWIPRCIPDKEVRKAVIWKAIRVFGLATLASVAFVLFIVFAIPE